MKKIKEIALSVAVAAVLASGFSGCASAAYQRALEEAQRMIEEQKKQPLPSLPAYPEPTVKYATSARVLIVGEEMERKLLSAALKAAGYAVTEQGDVQSASFNRPDFVLCPSLEPGMEYGDGSTWTRVRLIVSVRRPVALGNDGRPLPSAPPRMFQAYARAANPGDVHVLTAEERRTRAQQIDSLKAFWDESTYSSIKETMEASFKASDEQVAKPANVAVANLMRIAPFRELLATP